MRQRVLVPMPGVDPRADPLAERLRALADPIRLRLLALLGHGDCPVTALAAALEVGQSLVSFHLAELQRAGLVRLERSGRFTYARLDHPAARTLLAEVGQLFDLPATEPPTLDQHPTTGPAPTRQAVLAAVLPGLHTRFDRSIGRDRVQRLAAEEAARLGGRADLDHPRAVALVGTHAAHRLRALAQAERRLPKPVPELLFVCVRNAGRSQMAAALANHLGNGQVHAWSAGSQPAPALHAEAVAVMAEIGVDLAAAFPKPWTNDLVRAADVVVTMGCGEDIPQFPGVRYVAWQIPDPAGRSAHEIRRIRDQLTTHTRALLDELRAPTDQPSSDQPSTGRGPGHRHGGTEHDRS